MLELAEPSLPRWQPNAVGHLALEIPDFDDLPKLAGGLAVALFTQLYQLKPGYVKNLLIISSAFLLKSLPSSVTIKCPLKNRSYHARFSSQYFR